jgi:hypothetical protein
MDFSGDWAPVQDEDNTGNPYTGEFIGIPMSHAGALRAQAWNASLYTLPEWQCRPHGAMYISRGPSQVRIWKEVDPDSREVIAFHAEWLRSIDNPYYMDGRPRPSKYAPHTWGGFSTAEFIGDMLKITTTNLKEDYYRRNGVPSSDQATLTQYWIRRGDILTWVTIATDPIYLTEPMTRVADSALSVHGGRGSGSAFRRGPALSARRESFPERFRQEIQHSHGSQSGRRSHHVSRAPSQNYRGAQQRSGQGSGERGGHEIILGALSWKKSPSAGSSQPSRARE